MKIFEAIVISSKMNNTAIVEITRKTPHPLYGKLIKRSKKYKVDTLGQELTIGQKVKIVETKPISKEKYFKVMGEGTKKTNGLPTKEKTTRPAAKAKVGKKETK